ncbi:DUF2064 domain-containing protein [Salinispora arenicola]|uniref:DUF2064 domain-containing protein n=1 Tax=Salinispora arenicola TaxID=168697 RepID=UPI00142FCDD3|nr:DUF2064 domain-containing protein [Salinispora arenicola]NIL41789.1 DUF2064 domain-containing protein [Salinispora arenicola]
MTVLLVVAKSPIPGAVKTRLCPPATPAQAARVAAASLRDTIDVVAATPGVTPVLALHGQLADGVDGAALSAAVAGWTILWQRGAGLGARLAAAHEDVAAAYPGRPVLQIGMDTPQVTPALLGAAARPPGRCHGTARARRGRRWWALGLADPRHAAALRDVPMSTAETGRHTVAALAGRGLRVAPLPMLRDVDGWADALAVADAAPAGRFAARVAVVRPPAGNLW